MEGAGQIAEGDDLAARRTDDRRGPVGEDARAPCRLPDERTGTALRSTTPPPSPKTRLMPKARTVEMEGDPKSYCQMSAPVVRSRA